RRRLRRDLHDGLGPTLAALTLKIGAARKLLPYDQSAVDRLLLELNGDIETTVGDIRRLVYNLRPPSLDELGLVGAIRERVAQSILTCDTGDVDGLQVTVDAPEHLPLLAAAVEVAAYRIVQEALTNVVRHSSARTCRICLSLQETLFLRIEVRDDGIGWTAEQRLGVGIHSMYERATELGGTCFVEPIVTGGTRVVACLPLSDE
ncbi:MAG TPA: histidine kinase, partial [Ktedonobacteraceae bacterium]|nr:histidine kinase [Ktedonobacteraceae bacterium]